MVPSGEIEATADSAKDLVAAIEAAFLAFADGGDNAAASERFVHLVKSLTDASCIYLIEGAPSLDADAARQLWVANGLLFPPPADRWRRAGCVNEPFSSHVENILECRWERVPGCEPVSEVKPDLGAVFVDRGPCNVFSLSSHGEVVGLLAVGGRTTKTEAELALVLEPLLCSLGALFGSRPVWRQRNGESDEFRMLESWRSVILEAVNDAVLMLEPDGTITHANRTTKRIFGHDPDWLVGRDISILKPVDERRELLDTAETPGRLGENRVVQGLHRDGRVLTLQLSMLEVSFERQRRFVLTIQDFTELAALAHQNQLFANVLDATPDLVMAHTADGRIIASNPATDRFCGARPGHLPSNTDMRTFLTEQARRTLKDEVYPTVAAEGLWQGQLDLTRQGASLPTPYSVVVTSMPSEDGETLIAIARDDSCRLAALRSQENFVAAVSHELRTPLTSIRAALAMVCNDVVGHIDDEARDLLNLAERNSETLSRLVDDLLDSSIARNGRLSVQRRAMDVRLMLEGVIESLQTMAQMADVDLVLFFDGELPPIDGDSERLAQLITNLVGNAIKFSTPHQRVTVRGECTDAGAVRVSVSDNGPGIALSDQEWIFRPFTQISSSAARTHGGTGLGLAIAKAIAHAHETDIFVESDGESGTTFTIELQPSDGGVLLVNSSSKTLPTPGRSETSRAQPNQRNDRERR